jgi:hypothetical protein
MTDRSDETLEQARARLRKAAQEQSRFLVLLSHKISDDFCGDPHMKW